MPGSLKLLLHSAPVYVPIGDDDVAAFALFDEADGFIGSGEVPFVLTPYLTLSALLEKLSAIGLTRVTSKVQLYRGGFNSPGVDFLAEATRTALGNPAAPDWQIQTFGVAVNPFDPDNSPLYLEPLEL